MKIFLSVAVLLLLPVPAFSAGAVNPFGGIDLILVPAGLILIVVVQVIFMIKNITKFNSTKRRFIRFLGIWSAVVFWPFLYAREIYYLNEFIYRVSFALLALFFLAPFVCCFILKREQNVHSGKRSQSDAAEPRR